MPAKEVSAYVQRLRAAGYGSAQIRQQLVAGGLSPVQAFLAVMPFALWIAGGVAGVSVLAIVLAVALSGPAFTMTTQPSSVEVRAGSSVSFADVFTFQRDVGATVALHHDVIAPATGNIILSADQRVPAAAKASSSVKLPATLAPGRYIIKTTADADGHTAESTFTVKVVAAALVTPTYSSTPATSSSTSSTTPPTLTCDDFDACTTDVVKDGACVFSPMPVCCGDYVCDGDKGETTGNCARDCSPLPVAKTSVEIIAEAQSEAVSNPVHAEQLCGTLAQVVDADQCYDAVARTGAHSLTCARIATDSQRDSCYLYFAINQKEYAVCDSIATPALKSSCYSFKNLAGVVQESQSA